ncbi:MAG: hypothetical protein V4685_06325 [Bacteroidota bacterium]
MVAVFKVSFEFEITTSSALTSSSYPFPEGEERRFIPAPNDIASTST